MKRKSALRFVMVALGLLATSAAAWAHHSFAATYDESMTIEIKGRIVVFQFRNPHSFVTVEVKEASGKTVRWGVEGPGSTQLANSNIQNDTLRYGDEVVVTGNPSRDPAELRLRMVNVRRTSDGANWGFTAGQFVN